MKLLFQTVLKTVVVASFLFGVATVALPTVGYALTPQEEACQAVNGSAGCAGTGVAGGDLSPVIKIVINTTSILAGVLAVVMLIFGGIKYITSGGDSSKTTSAKNTIVYALIGLVIVAMSQFIVKYVLSKASDPSATTTTNTTTNKTNTTNSPSNTTTKP